MVASRETNVYRQDARSKGTFLTPKQREDLLKPYLPAPPTNRSPAPASRKRRLQPVQTFLKHQVHLLVFLLMHTLFSVYIRIRQTYHVLIDRVFAILYYHHRAPELIRQDVKNLSRIPEHLSVILELKGKERGTAGLEALVDEVAEISAWCSCVGIPTLSVYEKTGMIPQFGDFTMMLIRIRIRYPEGLHSHNSSVRYKEITQLLWTVHTVSPDSSASRTILLEWWGLRRG